MSLNLIDTGLALQAASIGQYYRIPSVHESSALLFAEAERHNAILQRKGKKLVIATRLMHGYKRVQKPMRPDPKEVA